MPRRPGAGGDGRGGAPSGRVARGVTASSCAACRHGWARCTKYGAGREAPARHVHRLGVSGGWHTAAACRRCRCSTAPNIQGCPAAGLAVLRMQPGKSARSCFMSPSLRGITRPLPVSRASDLLPPRPQRP